MGIRIRKVEVLALALVLAVLGGVFLGGVLAGRAQLLDDLAEAETTAAEAQEIAADAIESAQESADQVAGLKVIIESLEASLAARPETSSLEPTIAPKAYTPQPAPRRTTTPRPTIATQSRQEPAGAVTSTMWPTTQFGSKAACDAHYRARMTYWLKRYGVYTEDYLAHCLNIIWGESRGDCDARNVSDHVGLCQYSRDWWTSGDDWRTNGDTNLRRLAKAIADGGHAALERHWSATMGGC
ncbi:MAG: hypothetical protein ABFC80_03845 [Coriobacteriales bacterium]